MFVVLSSKSCTKSTRLVVRDHTQVFLCSQILWVVSVTRLPDWHRVPYSRAPLTGSKQITNRWVSELLPMGGLSKRSSSNAECCRQRVNTGNIRRGVGIEFFKGMLSRTSNMMSRFALGSAGIGGLMFRQLINGKSKIEKCFISVKKFCPFGAYIINWGRRNVIRL